MLVTRGYPNFKKPLKELGNFDSPEILGSTVKQSLVMQLGGDTQRPGVLATGNMG